MGPTTAGAAALNNLLPSPPQVAVGPSAAATAASAPTATATAPAGAVVARHGGGDASAPKPGPEPGAAAAAATAPTANTTAAGPVRAAVARHGGGDAVAPPRVASAVPHGAAAGGRRSVPAPRTRARAPPPPAVVVDAFSSLPGGGYRHRAVAARREAVEAERKLRISGKMNGVGIPSGDPRAAARRRPWASSKM